MKRKRADTPESLEPYLILCAELVDEYGEVMQPWLDRLEAEYAKAKQKRDAGKQVDRIRAMLAADKAPPPA
ncbi:hypothetical protein GR138_12140 [Shinella kummerowiae]|jgi:hypothetical protein|uniref:Uncharacterized protein n=1 Tax=Shinella kummerowiae TaxID=417745 RepID=A0A6N8SA48_9HYPH|nr:hypothetical protein [Shinella kummerowiae]MXN45944.1 hypothetical protein [Shinella kummerowiae]